jgi:HD-like signal output (HDOD) protein
LIASNHETFFSAIPSRNTYAFSEEPDMSTMTQTAMSEQTAPQPPEQLRRRILDRVGDLRMIPDVAVEAMAVAKNPDCSTSDFSTVVERDTKLATDILGMANSVAFSHGLTVASLHTAVTRLGFRRCRNLILTSSVAGLMQKMSLDQQWVREQLWRHSFTTAMMSLHLNRLLKLGFQGEEFTAGLLHDFGRTLLAVALPEQFPEADSLGFDEGPELLEHERSVLGADHCEVGAWFAGRGGIPASLVASIQWHHTPVATGEHARLVALTAVADHMANFVQRNQDSTDYDPSENEAICVLAQVCGRPIESEIDAAAASLMSTATTDSLELSAPLQ